MAGNSSEGRVFVLGSVNRDLVVRVLRHPRAGETVSGADLQQFPGGKGANQAVAARRAGAVVHLAGAIGADDNGRAMRAFLAAESIDLANLRESADKPTGIAMITVDQSGENKIVVSPGANAVLTAEDAERLQFGRSDVVLAQFEVPDAFIIAGFRRAGAAGARTVLNLAPMRPLSAELLAHCDYLILNETELEAASGGDALVDGSQIEAAAQALTIGEKGDPGRTVVVTLGAAGCLAADGASVLRLGGQAVPVVDTTGAGDCFAGVFAAGLAAGLALEAALKRANRAAAISVTRPGAAGAMPHAREIL